MTMWDFSQRQHILKRARKNNRRPANVIKKNPDDDNLHIPSKSRKHVPGASNYAGITKNGKKICIIGDSIIQRIKIRHINENLDNGLAFKKVVQRKNKILEKKDVDCVVLHIGK